MWQKLGDTPEKRQMRMLDDIFAEAEMIDEEKPESVTLIDSANGGEKVERTTRRNV